MDFLGCEKQEEFRVPLPPPYTHTVYKLQADKGLMIRFYCIDERRLFIGFEKIFKIIYKLFIVDFSTLDFLKRRLLIIFVLKL